MYSPGLALGIHKSTLGVQVRIHSNADFYHIKLIVMISFTFGKDTTVAIEANAHWLQVHHGTSISTKAQYRIYAT